MPTTIHTTVTWRRHAAGEIVRCQECGGDAFAKVLPGSVTWLCREPRLATPPPGGSRYACRRCKRAHWGFTVPETDAQFPPAMAVA